MSGQYNSASDYLRSLSEMSDGNYASFYRSLSGQVMFPEPGVIDPELRNYDPPELPKPAGPT